MSHDDLNAIWLSLHLASVTTVILLILGTPLAWWLARSSSKLAAAVEAVVALPLVLPPTVLGFYLLVAFSPDSAFAKFWMVTTGDSLSFSFDALVIASVIYSLPFVVQPLQSSFAQVSEGLLEAAQTMGAGFMDRFLSVVFPLCKRSFLAAATLGFAHTIGEFGVVLMIGGNIPGETQVLSIALYDRVESLNYPAAHTMAAGLLVFSFLALLLVYGLNRRGLWRNA